METGGIKGNDSRKTLLECLSSIVVKTATGAEDEKKFNPSVYEDAKEDISEAGAVLGTTERETVVFANILEQSCNRHLGMDDVAKEMGITYIKSMTYEAELSSLERKKLIRRNEDEEILVPTFVKSALAQNKPYEKEDYSGLDTAGVLERFRRMFKMRQKDEISENDLMSELDTLMTADTQSQFVLECRDLGFRGESGEMKYCDRLLFYSLVYFFIFDNDDNVGWSDFDGIFEYAYWNLRRMKNMFKERKLKVVTEGVIEPVNEDGIRSPEYFHISNKVKDVIFAELGGSGADKESNGMNTIRHNEIVAKDLFYNKENGAQVSRLRSLLEQESYSKTCERLKDRGLRSGFTCLFYGSPGTGKTETVYQLARQTGRDIILVNVPDIKSCWVGESEKNIKGLFDQYRKKVSKSTVAPILLFNEADAIFGIRQEGATRAVDKMENSIQNIILQEMEKLDGILIATTNLTTNLDNAFERRFLYKIRTLAEDMIETMYEANGVGLAAPQVGILKRIVVIDVGDGQGPYVMINPEILESSGEQTGDEGCLSVPGKAGQVTRPNYVKTKYYDLDMQEHIVEGTELFARCMCHEFEHLDGHLYVERVEGELHDVVYEEEDDE